MTARDIYLGALGIINERDGEGELHRDTGDFEKNAPALITLVLSRLWFSDSTVRGIPLREWRYTVDRIKSLDDPVPLHVSLEPAATLYLASLLLHEEEHERSNYYLALARESEERAVSGFLRARHDRVRDVYS